MEPWICPRCGIVHAGWVPQCTCKPPTMRTSSTTAHYHANVVRPAQCQCHRKTESTAPIVCPMHDLAYTFPERGA